MEFSAGEASALLSDTSDFTVIGVIGTQGAGKSTLMSMLAGARWAEGDHSWQLHKPSFVLQSTETILQAAHQTCGCDLYVTPERLLLLDTQPLLSPSVLLELQRRDTPLSSDVQTHENLLELHSLRVALLVLSVCHVVVCVHDARFDPLTLRMLRLAQTLRHRVPDISVLAQASPAAAAAMVAASAAAPNADESPAPVIEYMPRVAFVFNRMPPDAFEPGRLATVRAVLHRLLASSSGSGGGGSSGGGGGGAAVEALEDGTTRDVFCLPLAGLGGEHLGASHLGYRAEANQCRDSLLSLRRRPFARSMSEKDWLRGVGRMWDLIRRSAVLSDYNRTLQKLHLFS